MLRKLSTKFQFLGARKFSEFKTFECDYLITGIFLFIPNQRKINIWSCISNFVVKHYKKFTKNYLS